MIAKTGHIPYIAHEIRRPEEMTLSSSFFKKRTGYHLFKRFFDLIFSVLVIAGILSWLLPILGLLIRLDSGGPVFFMQKRIGWRGRLFTCYKLRTMIVNEEADFCPAAMNDHRVTRIGKFLRRSNLDELPQFFNVLSGSMSLVGPRPYMIADCSRFSEMVPDVHFRNHVKPGITGLAQVRGLHGKWSDYKTVQSRYQWDAFYVRRACFRMDVRIIYRTCLRFFTKQTPL
jgi:putative colanic acid biosynthesis UDP-glucose lipid carrier transferase